MTVQRYHAPGRSRKADLRPEAIGGLVHEVVAGLVATHGLSPGIRAVEGAVRRLLPRDLAPVYRQTVLIRVSTAVARYFAVFDRRPEWQPLGVEVYVADVRLDIVWRRGTVIEADEIKSGFSAGTTRRSIALAQARAELAAGRRVFGDRFGGVRLVVLGDPAASFFVRPGGRLEPINPSTLRRSE